MADVYTPEVGEKKSPNNFRIDWWIWMKCFMEVMTLKVTSIIQKRQMFNF
jgi:hypothetical protein